MRKLITKKEALGILVSHGAQIGKFPDMTYNHENAMDGNFLSITHEISYDGFLLSQSLYKNIRSNTIHDCSGYVSGGGVFAAFLVDNIPEFAGWRDRFLDDRRILATRDTDEKWQPEAANLAADIVKIAAAGGAVYKPMYSLHLYLT